MILNKVYVKSDIIARMQFVANDKYGDGTPIPQHQVKSHADILTTYGSQIQVKCNEEAFFAAMRELDKTRASNE